MHQTHQKMEGDSPLKVVSAPWDDIPTSINALNTEQNLRGLPP